jgi:hypothetical protein
LAVKKVLKRRGMKIDTCCGLCNRLDEDGGHLFIRCKEVKGVWKELNLEAVRCRLAEAKSAKEMMEMILQLEAKSQMTVIFLLWLWWDERNKWREEGKRRTAANIAYVTTMLTDRFQTKQKHRLLSDSRQVQHWKKPRQGEFKINSDGAFDPITGSGGWGFIIRDDRGMMIKAGAGREAALLDAFHAELLGCLAGLKAAIHLGLHKIVMEVDASLIKAAVEGDDYRLSAMGGVITELRCILLYDFAEAKFEVCPRICNRVADALAAYGCKNPSDDSVTWESVPHFVEDLVTSDLAESNE